MLLSCWFYDHCHYIWYSYGQHGLASYHCFQNIIKNDSKVDILHILPTWMQVAISHIYLHMIIIMRRDFFNLFRLQNIQVIIKTGLSTTYSHWTLQIYEKKNSCHPTICIEVVKSLSQSPNIKLFAFVAWHWYGIHVSNIQPYCLQFHRYFCVEGGTLFLHLSFYINIF